MFPAILATLMTAARAEAAPLDGCTDASSADAVAIACDAAGILLALVEADIPEDERAEFVPAFAKMKAGNLGAQIAPESVSLDVGGRTTRALVLVPEKGNPAGKSGFVVSGASPSGQFRIVFCIALDGRANLAARCGPPLGEVLSNGVSTLRVAPASTVSVLGRRVDVPAGCAVRVDQTITEIRCVGGAAYNVQTFPDPATRASSVALMRAFEAQIRSQAADATFSDMDCSVLGEPGACRLAKIMVNGAAFESLFGVGAIGGVPVTTFCTATQQPLRDTGCTTLVRW